MEKVLEGVSQFKKNIFPDKQKRFEELAGGQAPEVLFITCSDSRIDPNLITQTEPGELFICRNAGNIVPPHSLHTGGMTASIEYAVGALNVTHVVVCGHTDCGAMKGALNKDQLTEFPHVCDWLSHSDAACRIIKDNHGNAKDDEKLTLLIEQNVLLQLQHLKTHPYVASRIAAGKLELHGWVYNIEKGTFTCYNEATGKFDPLLMDKEREAISH